MRAVIQRVREASVTVAGEVVGAIGNGLLILLGVCHTDTAEDVELLAEKIAQLRIFSDHEGKFNLSLLDVGGAALVVSQFTLMPTRARVVVQASRRLPGLRLLRRWLMLLPLHSGHVTSRLLPVSSAL